MTERVGLVLTPEDFIFYTVPSLLIEAKTGGIPAEALRKSLSSYNERNPESPLSPVDILEAAILTQSVNTAVVLTPTIQELLEQEVKLAQDPRRLRELQDEQRRLERKVKSTPYLKFSLGLPKAA